jgi:hypothetical protein
VSRRSTRRLFGAALATLGTLGALPEAAGANTTVSYYPPGQPLPSGVSDFSVFIQGDGASDKISVQWRSDVQPTRVQVGQLEIVSPVTFVAGQNCTSPAPSTVHCNQQGELFVQAFLGSGDDTLVEQSPSSGLFSSPLFVNAGNGNDHVTGGRGNDTLQGASGDDRLEGGAGDDFLGGSDVGRDGFSGGSGKDRISANDNAADAFVDCGSQPIGRSDEATLDLADLKVVNCEHIEQFAFDDGPPGLPQSGPLRLSRSGVSGVRITCRRTSRVRCRGRASLRDPRRRTRVLDSADYNVALGARGTALFQLTSDERTLLRQRGRVLVTTREQGVSRKGPRSAQQTLAVAG